LSYLRTDFTEAYTFKLWSRGISPTGETKDLEMLDSSIQYRTMIVLLVANAFGLSGKLLADADEKSIELAQSKYDL